MATVYPCSFSNKLVYKIKFDAQIRGHHVSKEIWTTQKDDILYCKKDYLSEALDIDKHGIGTYKEERLVGHTPPPPPPPPPPDPSLKRDNLTMF